MSDETEIDADATTEVNPLKEFIEWRNCYNETKGTCGDEDGSFLYCFTDREENCAGIIDPALIDC